MRTIFVVGLIIALGAFLVGPAPTAVRLRGALSRMIDRLRRGGVEQATAGWARRSLGACAPSGAAGRGGSSAALVVIFLDRPTGGDILAVALLLVVLLGVIEFLNRPPFA